MLSDGIAHILHQLRSYGIQQLTRMISWKSVPRSPNWWRFWSFSIAVTENYIQDVDDMYVSFVDMQPVNE